MPRRWYLPGRKLFGVLPVLMTGRERLYLHPFLFAIYPVLFLYTQNLQEAQAPDLVRPMLVSLIGTAFVYLIARVLIKSAARGAIITSILIAAVFAYGHVITPVRGCAIAGLIVGRGAFLVPLWSLLALVAVVWVARKREEMSSLSHALTLASGMLVVLSLGQIVLDALNPKATHSTGWLEYASSEAVRNKLDMPADSHRPDVYLIILDEYARDDVLRDVFGYDNSRFLNSLRSKGFYVADKSHSNYMFTYASLASSLNMDYLHTLADNCGAESIGKQLAGDMIEDAMLIHLLKNAGYKFYMFPSEFYVTNRNRNADALFRRTKRDLNEFERVLFATTAIHPLYGGARNHRLNRLYKFRTLSEMPETPGPKLVFAHIVMPHPPYVFDRDGNPPPQGLFDRNAYTIDQISRLYVGQVQYLNTRVEEVVDSILKQSKVPPIILIQGDHGFRHKIGEARTGSELPAPQRSAILNAVYLPDGAAQDLYPAISPVNTMRFVFNRFFGCDYPMLSDETYEAEDKGGKYGFKSVARWSREGNPSASATLAQEP